MCGIAGFIGPLGSPESDAAVRGRILNSMVGALAHRGPDGNGEWFANVNHSFVALGHTRLAILDLSDAARQPMVDSVSGCVLIFNGEIYNFRDLRAEFKDDPRPFSSTGDTELLLRAYLRWGDSFVKRLRGMFAFCIYDPRTRHILLGRDHFGIKPLYLTFGHGSRIGFASEVRALLNLPWVSRSLDLDGLVGYLAYGSVQEPFTLVSGIRSLPPGHTLTINLSDEGGPTITTNQYWELPPSPPVVRTNGHFQERAAEVRSALADSLRHHMVSDVPVGVFLSGGMDSSTIIALASGLRFSDVRALTVSFDDAQTSDSSVAKLVARRYGIAHTEIALSAGTFLGDFFKWLDSQDQPSMDGANTWVISRACREAGLKVALSGLGADELFAGYSTFTRMQVAGRLFRAISWIPRQIRSAIAGHLARQSNGKRLFTKLAEWMPGDGSMVEIYLTLRRIFPVDVSHELLDPLIPVVTAGDLHPGVMRRLRTHAADADTISATSRFELSTYLVNTLLRDSDQMGMAHSLEIRVPFVDWKLAETVLSMPGDTHLAHGPKSLLRAAMGDNLDSNWIDRPKEGFTFPFDQWFREDLREGVEERLMDMSEFPFRGGAVPECWRRFQAANGVGDSSSLLSLVALGSWMKRHRIESCS